MPFFKVHSVEPRIIEPEIIGQIFDAKDHRIAAFNAVKATAFSLLGDEIIIAMVMVDNQGYPVYDQNHIPNIRKYEIRGLRCLRLL